MISAYDTESGLFYQALTSRKRETPALDEPKQKSSLSEGLAIIAGFVLCATAIVIAI